MTCGTREAVERKIAKICGRQYLRTLVRWEVVSGAPGRVQVRLWSDLEEYRRRQTRYFGLRILVTNRSAWSTAQIIAAYRGQAKAESAFRDLKDPGLLATRPQFHWTDQKLHVHAFMCVSGYLLVRLLWWRARRATDFAGSPHSLLSELSRIRCCRVIEKTGRAGPGYTGSGRKWTRPCEPSDNSSRRSRPLPQTWYIHPDLT